VIAASTTGQGAYTVADPRLGREAPFNDVYRVVRWDRGTRARSPPAGRPSAGGQSVADPRVASKREGGEFSSARHYGVVRWDRRRQPDGDGHASHDNGAHSVADPRDPREKCCPWIWSLDGTRHRPLTTLELAALQGYPLDQILQLELGGSDSVRREHIGNGVPVATAQAIASTMLGTLLLAAAGQTFALSVGADLGRPPHGARAVGGDAVTPSTAGDRMNGAQLIADERRRQVLVEGWSPEHDDGHADGELAAVAAGLALDGFARLDNPAFGGPWDPWHLIAKHRGNRIRQLVIAGALIAAEIDRLERQAGGPRG
jgi:hypothetical protein